MSKKVDLWIDIFDCLFGSFLLERKVCFCAAGRKNHLCINTNIDERLKNSKIQKLFLPEKNVLCNKCIYRFLCGGLCAAESVAMNQLNENNCGFKKIFSEFLLFYYMPHRGAEQNVMEFYKFLSNKENEINGEK